jgi:hypothetical protein
MITIIARASFAIAEFTDESPVTVHGGARVESGVLRLTPALPGQVGAAWYDAPAPISGGFTTELRYALSGQRGHAGDGGTAGGGGFAFVVRGVDSAAIGERGAGVGDRGITHSLAVEFDTCPRVSAESPYHPAGLNADGSTPPGDHVSVNARGAAASSAFHDPVPLGCTTRWLKLASTARALRMARITYRPGTAGGAPRIRVFMDEAVAPLLEVPLEQPLEALLGLGPDAAAWVGFTAATGAGRQAHEIVSWSFAARSSGPAGIRRFIGL